MTVQDAENRGGPSQMKRNSLPLNARVKTLPAWVECQCCDEFWCLIHGTHAFECECPAIDEWEETVYPYSNMPGNYGLDPRLARWLMGYPSTWLSCVDWETPSSPK